VERGDPIDQMELAQDSRFVFICTLPLDLIPFDLFALGNRFGNRFRDRAFGWLVTV
jgi:hypothetical protein